MNINKIKNSAGYTLIELLTVVTIIGILASIAIPNYRGYRDKAKMVTVYTTLHQIRLLQEVYWTDHEDFFDDTNGIEIQIPRGQTYTITKGIDEITKEKFYLVVIDTDFDRNQDGTKDTYKFQHWTSHEDRLVPLYPVVI